MEPPRNRQDTASSSMRAVSKTSYRLAAACVLSSIVACSPSSDEMVLTGQTQGTSYSVRAYCPTRQPDLHAAIDAELARVDAEMSTYNPTSILSRFNAAPPGSWQPVSADMADVVAAAQQLAEMSGGAFDVTVGPLVNLWGFGPTGEISAVPPAAAVAAARARVGHGYLQVRMQPPALRKQRALYVDLGAIAQGYTVDAVAALLNARQCASYLVEVGGEVRAGAAKPSGEGWRVGIEVPDPTSVGRLQRVLTLTNAAVSTSGDYRDFVDLDGKRYSHTIDPRSGAPVTHDLASVTVIHDSTMWADGYATLLDVLGPRAGLEFARQHHLAAQFTERTPAGLVETTTPEFVQFINEATQSP
jgi:FAD:protein FMN transferase